MEEMDERYSTKKIELKSIKKKEQQEQEAMTTPNESVCPHCINKLELWENEAGGMREYKSYWHDPKSDGNLVECWDNMPNNCDLEPDNAADEREVTGL